MHLKETPLSLFYMFQKCSLSGFSVYECLYTECLSVIYVQVVGNMGISGKSRYENFQTLFRRETHQFFRTNYFTPNIKCRLKFVSAKQVLTYFPISFLNAAWKRSSLYMWHTYFKNRCETVYVSDSDVLRYFTFVFFFHLFSKCWRMHPIIKE